MKFLEEQEEDKHSTLHGLATFDKSHVMDLFRCLKRKIKEDEKLREDKDDKVLKSMFKKYYDIDIQEIQDDREGDRYHEHGPRYYRDKILSMYEGMWWSLDIELKKEEYKYKPKKKKGKAGFSGSFSIKGS